MKLPRVDYQNTPQEDLRVFPNLPYETMPFSMESVGISHPDKTYLMQRCCADITVFEYVIKGSGDVATTHNSFCPNAGDSYMLRCGESHRYQSNPEDPWEKIWVNVRGTLIFPILDAYGLTGSMCFPGLDISPYILRIHEIAYDRNLTDYEIMDRSFIVFLEMCQFISRSLPSEGAYKHIPENIARLKQYMDDHLQEHLVLEKCSSITYLSVSQTIRSFRAAYGITPYEYLNQRRINTAKLLLTNSNLSIEEIAAETGFPDRNYFSKYFKKKVGQSPSRFRKQQ